VITGTLTDTETTAPLAGRDVTVERRPAGSAGWATVRTSTTATAGTVSVTVRPAVNTSYRLVAVAAGGYMAATSKTINVHVRPRLTLTGHDRVKVSAAAHVKVTSTPKQRDQSVSLQRRKHGRWVTIAHAALGSAGRHTFTVHFAHTGAVKCRVIEAATSQHLAATSRTLAITVH
jgi:hypothetical protein